MILHASDAASEGHKCIIIKSPVVGALENTATVFPACSKRQPKGTSSILDVPGGGDSSALVGNSPRVGDSNKLPLGVSG